MWSKAISWSKRRSCATEGAAGNSFVYTEMADQKQTQLNVSSPNHISTSALYNLADVPTVETN
jgi:hypothetical protein